MEGERRCITKTHKCYIWRVVKTKEIIKKWGKRFSGIFPLERGHTAVKPTIPAEYPKTGQVKEQNRKRRSLLGTAKPWMQANMSEENPGLVCTIYTDFFSNVNFKMNAAIMPVA